MPQKSRFLRLNRRETEGHDTPPDYAPRSEREEARRAVRDWLRTDEIEEREELFDWAVGNGWE